MQDLIRPCALLAGCIALGILSVSCSSTSPGPADVALVQSDPESTAAGSAAEASVGADFSEVLKRGVAMYSLWDPVDTHARWSPLLCKSQPPPAARSSKSGDDDTHGRKLYALYAKYPMVYLDDEGAPQAPIGQVLVKRAFHPVAVALEDVPKRGSDEREQAIIEQGFDPWVITEDKAWTLGEEADLFVMLKLDPKTPGTDQGWVYAVLDAEGQEVREAGRLANCMDCHVETPRDRQFGMPNMPGSYSNW